VPFVAKVIGRPVAKIAARIMAGESLDELRPLREKSSLKHIAVKEAVFPFARFPGVDTLLGPEMKSTGEVMGLDTDFALAFAKSQLGAGSRPAAFGHGVRLRPRRGQATDKINKVLEGRPHIEDAIRNRQVQLVFNTTDGQKAVSDSKSLRRATLMQKVPYYTTLAGMAAATDAIAALKAGSLEVRRLQEYF
jgi:carbamoyl-phosphate synthase large subunit